MDIDSREFKDALKLIKEMKCDLQVKGIKNIIKINSNSRIEGRPVTCYEEKFNKKIKKLSSPFNRLYRK